MYWGRKWGNFWGKNNAEEIEIIDFEEYPPAALVRWALFDANALYHVMVDGKQYDRTTGLELCVQFQDEGRHWVEVMVAGAGNMDEDVSDFISSIPGSRARLAWTASVASDLSHYKIYWNEGSGDPDTYYGRTKADETTWISDVLENGTYKFKVQAVDEAGNEKTTSSSATITIAHYPDPPSALSLSSYNESTGIATFAFTESDTAGITGYKVYGNTGGGGYVDYDTVLATVATGNESFTMSLTVGTWKIGIRTYNATYTEDNVDVVTDFSLGGSPTDLLENQPNIPLALAAIPASGGTFTFKCTYDAWEERGKATQINFYANDGAGGSVNYVSAVATATVGDHTTAEQYLEEIEATSTAFTDGNQYIFGCKAATLLGRESDASDTTTGIADATVPEDISGLTATEVNYEED